MARPPNVARPFRYWLDPVCLTATAIYVLGRWVVRPSAWGRVPLVHDHLNDLLCIPIFLPAVLLVHRGIDLRRHDRPPTAFEVMFHLALWSVCFEFVAPRLDIYRTTAGPLDVAAYAAGALAAGLFWGSWRGRFHSAPDAGTVRGVP